MDKRYEDPTIAKIYLTWRNRQNMVRAEAKLVLQIKAICRSFRDGDIKEANKLFAQLKKGEGQEGSEKGNRTIYVPTEGGLPVPTLGIEK